ncbi:MAG: hypothetical protein LBQ27_03065 [Clostridiales bacterium]|jgi:beta-galactosidase|nr:hypothetical protein [Clostridiales bacterium]
MVYYLDKSDYKDFRVFERNKLAPRAYFIPFSGKAAAEGADIPLARYKSDRVIMLSGEWDFKYYPRISELPVKIDPDDIVFDKITVPSDWQRTGYEPPVYLNTRYPFKLDPPNFPEDCSVGLYRKNFELTEMGSRHYISFLGVMSGFDIYINGQHAGYSEGAHNTAEFELDRFLKRGQNEIVVVVYKWTNGTYLECQDMFRENGIFRDVFIVKQNAGGAVFDYEVKTTKINGKYDLKLTIYGSFGNNCELTAAVASKDGRILESKTEKAADKTLFRLDGVEADAWSAEIPAVYYLEITVKADGEEKEFIRDVIGFKTVEIDGEVLKFNDKPIKLLGVNHHDTDPINGYVMSAAQLENDVKLMKAHNINAVRTSHYPPDPVFLLYCDIYGLYVIDEADIETHGCYATVYKPDLISHDKAWAEYYLDRVKRMYMRDKNRPCIVMWSLGNEAGGYNNQDTVYDYLKEVCSEIPVHYEAVCRTARFRYDVTSEMYPDYYRIKKIAEKKAQKKYYGAPYFICEYCHAMGVGPGYLKEMTELFFSADIYLGGCIWEWADHAVYNADGKYKYTYGGDHGEELHDGNFCVDGLVYPDRRPHTGLKNVKVNYSPFKIKKTGVNTFEFFNRNFFRSADYISIKYIIEEDGKVIGDGILAFDTEPSAKHEFVLDCGKSSASQKTKKTEEEAEHDVYVTFEYVDNATGAVIAKEQITVTEKPLRPALEGRSVCGAEIAESENTLTFKFDGESGEVIISKKSGNIEQIIYDGQKYLSELPAAGITGIYDNIFRAPLDNDREIQKAQKSFGYENLKPFVKKVQIIDKKSDKSKKTVKATKYLINYKGQALFKVVTEYGVFADGAVTVSVKLKKKTGKKLPLLQKIGVNFEIDESFDAVRYYGRGPLENLPDFKEHAYMGVYEAKIKDMHEPYIKPQDNNYHTGIRRLEIFNGDGRELIIEAADKPLGFSAHNYTQGALAAAAHNEDIEYGGTSFISLDGFTMGTGGNSCGPLPLREYLLPPDKEYEYGFVIKTAKRKSFTADADEQADKRTESEECI